MNNEGEDGANGAHVILKRGEKNGLHTDRWRIAIFIHFHGYIHVTIQRNHEYGIHINHKSLTSYFDIHFDHGTYIILAIDLPCGP